MDNHAWLEDLNRLLVRFSPSGVCPDISDMERTQLWGVYCVLRRLAGMEPAGFVRGYR